MRKLIFTFILITGFISSASAQKFFRSVSLTGYLYFNDLYMNTDNWKHQFRPPSAPLAQNFDSLFKGRLREPDAIGFGRITGGKGVRLTLQKPLLFPEASRSKLEWNTGLGIRKFNYSNAGYGYGDLLFDTSKVYLSENEKFSLNQYDLDIYNSLVYTIYGREWKWLHLFIGFGLQASFSFSNKLLESYRATSYHWLTGQGWHYSTNPTISRTVAARANRALDFTVPMGWGVRLTKDLFLESSFEYLNLRYSSNMTTERYTEGGQFHLTFRYKL